MQGLRDISRGHYFRQPALAAPETFGFSVFDVMKRDGFAALAINPFEFIPRQVEWQYFPHFFTPFIRFGHKKRGEPGELSLAAPYRWGKEITQVFDDTT